MSTHTHDRALVLGPGGVVGTAWMVGLAHGLRRVGVDLAEADLIVGTSAGAIVGALLATDQDLARLATAADPAARDAAPDPGRLDAVFALLGDRSLDPAEARRRVGRLGLDGAEPGADEALVRSRATLIGADTWPERRLLITAVDATSGEPVVWDRDSGVPLARAVAASSAFPGLAPLVAIGGRRYMDGALRSGTNTDLAAGARTLVVIEPMVFLGERKDIEPADDVVAVGPDPAALRAFGPDVSDAAAWEPSYRAGLRQAGEVAGRLRPAWGRETGTA
ncbi:patatin-like phospholipase family protein [Actinomadura litoris]|uniref:Patatin-like phospholipase family protein n=1 Tax=Actinomadura litoris TaxID=2678616 RepID=A0A7K1L0T3_9ACTN|nr:patatin-like phospholipase family protein [Actinomadura litoris]MUN37947.1 patatin-like phospholipase family protein [Actinomadura litoris]